MIFRKLFKWSTCNGCLQHCHFIPWQASHTTKLTAKIFHKDSDLLRFLAHRIVNAMPRVVKQNPYWMRCEFQIINQQQNMLRTATLDTLSDTVSWHNRIMTLRIHCHSPPRCRFFTKIYPSNEAKKPTSFSF